MNSICVFAGSSRGARAEYADAARELGRDIAARQWTLVYGGGNIGLMGILADAVLQEGGRVVGVIPEALVAKEVAHQGLSQLRVVRSMHERKALMSELSQGVIALPGGLGTLEELFEMLTWAQLGIHAKPCGILNVRGYFDQLLSFLDRCVEQRFIRAEHRSLIIAGTVPRDVLDRMSAYKPPSVEKWLDKDAT